jgi:hypothetical protein
MNQLFAHIARRFRRFVAGDISSQYETGVVLTAQLHIERIRQLDNIENLRDVEFKAFSQWGEDGILQYLISRIPIDNRCFIEFGVENYIEANTRFLLINNNWKGLVLDGSRSNIDFIRNDSISWRHDLAAECLFITRENINKNLAGCGYSGDIGLLSIDIDGNDYWVWEKIDIISPRIVVCEYNSIFGCEHSITVPYDPEFIRSRAHYSNLYYGASLPALCKLAERKGYDFIGSNSTGSNAFFVRNDLQHNLRTLSAKEGYIESKVRESRDRSGRLSFLSGPDRVHLIRDMPVYEIERDKIVPIRDIM